MDINIGAKTESAVERAVKKAEQDPSNAYMLGKKYFRIMKEYLEPGEKVVLGARQSRLASLSPAVLLATNKKLVLLKPSFWRLHTGHILFKVSNIQFIQYHTIMDISFTRGRYLSSISIKMLNGGTVDVHSLKVREAKLLLGFVEDVVERTAGQGS
jgi:hypothetical protein